MQRHSVLAIAANYLYVLQFGLLVQQFCDVAHTFRSLTQFSCVYVITPLISDQSASYPGVQRKMSA